MDNGTSLPKVIKLGGRFFAFTDQTAKLKHGGHCGQILYDESVIEYSLDQSEESLKNTTLHEIIHGISEEYALDLDERQVTCIANAFMALATDNPDYIEWLMSQGADDEDG